MREHKERRPPGAPGPRRCPLRHGIAAAAMKGNEMKLIIAIIKPFKLEEVRDALADPAAPTIDKGDTAWMLTSSLLVLMMIVPGLALFYGGLARTKNMLSVMTQVGAVAALTMLIWVGWGYSEAFGDGGNAIIAGFGKALLHGVSMTSQNPLGATIPEYV